MAKNDRGTSLPQRSAIVAHPYTIVGEGLCHLVREAGFVVSHHVADVDALFKTAVELNPDMIIVDFRFLTHDATLIDQLKNKTRAIVAVMAVPEEIEEAAEALKAGAKGYLSYALSREDFIGSLSLLAQGSLVISSAASEQVQSRIDKGPEDIMGLSAREREIAVLVAQGATNREIADRLKISQHTVKNHLHHILDKLELRNRQQIAAYAIRQGLVEDMKTKDFS